jgi:hypothetical protein
MSNAKVRHRRRYRRHRYYEKISRQVDRFCYGVATIIFECPQCSKSDCLAIFLDLQVDDEDKFGDAMCDSCVAKRLELQRSLRSPRRQ